MNLVDINNIRKINDASLTDIDWARVWNRVGLLPANYSQGGPSWRPTRQQPDWRCALLLSWSAGAHLSEIFRAQPHEFDLAKSTWTLPPTDLREADRVLKLSKETRDAVAAAIANPRAGRSFIFGTLARSEAAAVLRRIGSKSGLPGLTFSRIRKAALARDAQDEAIPVLDVIEKYTRGPSRSDQKHFLKRFAKFERRQE